MCRGTTATGRRCPCDTSEARQARRDSQRLRSTKAFERTLPAPKNKTTLPGTENIEQQLNHVKGYRALIETLKTGESNIIQIVNEAGKTQFVARYENLEVVADSRFGVMERIYEQAELHTTKLGENILTAAENASVNEDTLRSLYVDRRAENLKTLDEAEAKRKEKQQAFDAAIPLPLKMIKGNKTPEEMYKIGKQFFTEQDKPQLVEKLTTAYHEFVDERNSFTKVKQRISQETNMLSEEFVEKNKQHIASLKETLSTVRDFGGELVVAENSDAAASKSVEAAVNLFPSDWVENSNNFDTGTGPMRVKKATGRAHYNDSATQRSTYRTVMHLDYSVQEESFTPTAESNTAGMWFKADENGWFTDPYSGNSHEILYSKKPVWVLVEAETFRPGSHAFKGGINLADENVVPVGKEWRKENVVEINRETGERMTVSRWRRPLSLKKKGKGIQPELTVTKTFSPYHDDAGYRVASHELSHRMESSNRYVTEMEQAFLKRRTTLPDGSSEPFVKLVNLPEFDGHPYGRNETTQKDDFVSAYIGKSYESNHREVLSMGMESIFAGSHGGLLGVGGYKRDRDYKSFILGLLASG